MKNYKKRLQLIITMAKEIQNIYHIQIPISDINKIITTMGGTIETSDSYNNNCIIRTSNNNFCIKLQKNSDNPENKLYIAQAIGYLFLNMKYQIDDTIYQTFIKNKAYHPKNIDDVNNINWFAGAFLMPPEIYKQIMIVQTPAMSYNPFLYHIPNK